MAGIGDSSTYLSATWNDLWKVVFLSGLIVLVSAISIYRPDLGIIALGLLLASFAFGVNLRWGVLSLIFLLSFDPQVEIRPRIFVYFDLLFILPVLPYLWKALFGNLRIIWPSLALAPFLVFAITTTFWRAENLYWFSAYSTRLVIAVMFMAVVAATVRAEIVTFVLGVTLVPQAIYATYQYLTGDLGSLYLLIYPHYRDMPFTDRGLGFFFQPNNFGSYCATVSVMLLALGLRAERLPLRIICCILAVFGFAGMASSGSRGAWLGAAAGIVLLFTHGSTRGRAKMTLAAGVVGGAILLTSIQYAPLERTTSLDAFTVETRSTAYLAGGLLFLQHPVIGVGLTNYQALMSSVVDWEYPDAIAAHNTYLQILSENGIIGFVLFFGPVFYLFYRSLKKARESTAALLSLVGLTVFLVHGLVDFQLMTAPQYLLLFAVLFGLASRIVEMPKAADVEFP